MKNFIFYLLVFCYLFKSLEASTQPPFKPDSLIKELNKQKVDSLKVDLLVEIGRSYMFTGNSQSALTYLKKALELSKKIKYKKGEGKALGTLGLVFSQLEQPDKALEYHNKAKKIRLLINDTQGLSNSLINIGNCYYDQGNFQLALKHFQDALQLRIKLDDKRAIADAYNSIGNVELNLGNFSESLKNYFQALKLFKEVNDISAEGATLNNIGLIFRNKGDYKEANKYYSEALKISLQIKDTEGLIYGYNNLGLSYYLLKDKDSAMYYYTKGLELARKNNNKRGLIMTLTNSAFLLADQMKFSEALAYHFESFNLSKELNDTAGLANSYNNIGELFIEEAKAGKSKDSLRSYKKAILYLDSGLILSKKTGEKDRLMNAYGGLYLAYKGLKDYKKALQFLELSKEMNDSLLNKEEYAKIAALQVDTEKEKVKAEQLLNQERIKERSKRKTTLILAISSLILVSGLFSFYIIRQKNLKAREIEKINTAHKMVELELQGLRAQLNPHFMFNSLNAIQELILKENSQKSHLYLSRFSELLRMLLDNANEPFIPLSRELHLADLYLSLEKLRVSNLQYMIDVKDKMDLDNILIPNMTLQPFLENALWHGLAQKGGDRKLYIKVGKSETEVTLEIEDNGIGRKKALELKAGKIRTHKSRGMELLSKRFHLLSQEYGSEIKTTITDLGENDYATGTRVNIQIPLKVTKASEAELV